jgi:hypothetical protein
MTIAPNARPAHVRGRFAKIAMVFPVIQLIHFGGCHVPIKALTTSAMKRMIDFAMRTIPFAQGALFVFIFGMKFIPVIQTSNHTPIFQL